MRKKPVPRLILFNKPFHVMCQFTDTQGRATLADYVPIADVYAAGRLDYTSEGLVILTDAGWLQHAISDPANKLPKCYWVRIEREPNVAALEKLRHGLIIQNKRTRPAVVSRMAAPDLWERTPPIRFRKSVPTVWLSLMLTEGRNRQVRRMTAAVGHPTLRLVRWSVGPWTLVGLAPGQWVDIAAPPNMAAWRKLGANYP